MTDDEIYFTARISKWTEEALIIYIPKVEMNAFQHGDLVKVTLIRKSDKTKEEADKNESTRNGNNA